MEDNQIVLIKTRLKIIGEELERICARIEDNNRSIREILKSGNAKENPELHDLITFNRFLFQKQDEKMTEKFRHEDILKSLLLNRIDLEEEWRESERRIEFFRLTVNKSIEFDQSHPYFNDPSFLKELISEFERREDFEACAHLSGITQT